MRPNIRYSNTTSQIWYGARIVGDSAVCRNLGYLDMNSINEGKNHELELGKNADFEDWTFDIRDFGRAYAACFRQQSGVRSSLCSPELDRLNTQHLGRHCQRRGDVKQ